MLGNQIQELQEHIKRTIHYDQVALIQGGSHMQINECDLPHEQNEG